MMDIKSMTDEELDAFLLDPKRLLLMLERLAADLDDINKTRLKLKEEINRMDEQFFSATTHLSRRIRTMKRRIVEMESQ